MLVSGEHRRSRGHMNEATMMGWLLQLRPIGVVLIVGFAPALIARWKRRPMVPWYLYGVACALLAWPAVALPALHALLVRPHGKPEQITQQRRRASALALLKEHNVRSYPSWIAELRCKSPIGIERCRYARDHLGPGEALALVRERAEAGDKHAVSYRHGDVHLGYVPRRHRWIAEAIDDGLRLLAVVETVKTGLVFRRRAKFVGTRIIVLYGSR
jgi:HIRAN domain